MYHDRLIKLQLRVFSKAKIERFWRTCKETWLYGLDMEKIHSLKEFNDLAPITLPGIPASTVHPLSAIRPRKNMSALQSQWNGWMNAS